MSITDEQVMAALDAWQKNWPASHETSMRAALEDADAAAWRPIEEAPRDGRYFLVWDNYYGVRVGKSHIRSDHDDWLSYLDAYGNSSKGGLRATHFRHLPESPK